MGLEDLLGTGFFPDLDEELSDLDQQTAAFSAVARDRGRGGGGGLAGDPSANARLVEGGFGAGREGDFQQASPFDIDANPQIAGILQGQGFEPERTLKTTINGKEFELIGGNVRRVVRGGTVVGGEGEQIIGERGEFGKSGAPVTKTEEAQAEKELRRMQQSRDRLRALLGAASATGDPKDMFNAVRSFQQDEFKRDLQQQEAESRSAERKEEFSFRTQMQEDNQAFQKEMAETRAAARKAEMIATNEADKRKARASSVGQLRAGANRQSISLLQRLQSELQKQRAEGIITDEQFREQFAQVSADVSANFDKFVELIEAGESPDLFDLVRGFESKTAQRVHENSKQPVDVETTFADAPEDLRTLRVQNALLDSVLSVREKGRTPMQAHGALLLSIVDDAVPQIERNRRMVQINRALQAVDTLQRSQGGEVRSGVGLVENIHNVVRSLVGQGDRNRPTRGGLEEFGATMFDEAARIAREAVKGMGDLSTEDRFNATKALMRSIIATASTLESRREGHSNRTTARASFAEDLNPPSRSAAPPLLGGTVNIEEIKQRVRATQARRPGGQLGRDIEQEALEGDIDPRPLGSTALREDPLGPLGPGIGAGLAAEGSAPNVGGILPVGIDGADPVGGEGGPQIPDIGAGRDAALRDQRRIDRDRPILRQTKPSIEDDLASIIEGRRDHVSVRGPVDPIQRHFSSLPFDERLKFRLDIFKDLRKRAQTDEQKDMLDRRIKQLEEEFRLADTSRR